MSEFDIQCSFSDVCPFIFFRCLLFLIILNDKYRFKTPDNGEELRIGYERRVDESSPFSFELFAFMTDLSLLWFEFNDESRVFKKEVFI